MTDDNDDNDFDEKPDLTRIEKLPEFLHEEDPDVDSQLDFGDKGTPESAPALDLSDLDDEVQEEAETDEEASSPPEFEAPEEQTFESETSEEVNFESQSEWEGQSESEFSPNEQESEFESIPDQEWSAPEEESSDESSSWQTSESDTFNLESEDNTFESSEENEQSFDSPESTETTEFGEDTSFEETSTEINEDEVAETEIEDDATTVMSFGEEQENFEAEPIEESGPQFRAPPPPTPPKAPVQLKKREDFQDIRQFGEALTYGTVAYGGQPPFTLKAIGINYKEDAEDIMIVLREHGLLNEENEKDYQQMLEHNSLLISQISEYSAIYLAHRLRRFNLQMSMGLSDELSPSKFYDKDGRGLVTKHNLRQNVREHVNISKTEFEAKDVLLSTSNQLEGMTIKRYYDIVSTHTILTEEELKQRPIDGEFDDLEISPPFQLGIGTVYQGLASDLKNEAYKKEANAVLGVSYQITPLPTQTNDGPMLEYKITCTGNAVWLENQ